MRIHAGVLLLRARRGNRKINQMCMQFGNAELAMFHAVAAFDPLGLLN
jgi:glycolate oxidase